MTYEELNDIKILAKTIGFDVNDNGWSEKHMFTVNFPYSDKYSTVIDATIRKNENKICIITGNFPNDFFKNKYIPYYRRKKKLICLSDITKKELEEKLYYFWTKYKQYIIKGKLKTLEAEFKQKEK